MIYQVGVFSAGGDSHQATSHQDFNDDRWAAAYQHADECLNEYCQNPKRRDEELDAIKLLGLYNQGDRSAYLLRRMEELVL